MKIGLLGCGTVGSGVYELLKLQRESLAGLYSEDIEVKRVLVKDIDKPRYLEDIEGLLTTNAYEILNDPEIELIVEALGGEGTAYEYIAYGLRNGKHVVTANKAVIARHMKELLELAEENNRALLFEASVGGGIPLLKPLKQRSLLNEFSEVKGILNGTSNFILTKMMEEELDFEEALAIARERGYAEADPSDDIEGADVARKLAILASIIFKDSVALDRISYRGIRRITKADIEVIKDLGYSVKLLGKAVKENDRLSAIVEPVLVKSTSLFERVRDAYNMVAVRGDNLEELSFYGEGAGKKATANAVVSDILDVVNGSFSKETILRRNWLKDYNRSLIKGNYFFRVTPKETSDYFAISRVFTRNAIVFSKRVENNDLIFITEASVAEAIDTVIEELEKESYSFFFGRLED